jgi:hypothetical protein
MTRELSFESDSKRRAFDGPGRPSRDLDRRHYLALKLNRRTGQLAAECPWPVRGKSGNPKRSQSSRRRLFDALQVL